MRSQKGLPKFGGQQLQASADLEDQSVSCLLFKAQIEKFQQFGKVIKDPMEFLQSLQQIQLDISRQLHLYHQADKEPSLRQMIASEIASNQDSTPGK